jgi:hypothetical protein
MVLDSATRSSHYIMANTTKLSSTYTVSRYKELIDRLDAAPPQGDAEIKAEIVAFFVERFTERYITPINAAHKKKKHGFCTMAVSCLMIEALECFWSGWRDTNETGKGKLAFRQFFQRIPALSAFRDVGPQFYKNVRCGILHQAETTGGWTVVRYGPLFDTRRLRINATTFHRVVEESLLSHARSLKTADRNSERWINFKTKMGYVCGNC